MIDDFADLWTPPHGRYVLIEPVRDGGGHLIWDTGTQRLVVIEDDDLYAEVQNRMIAAGVPTSPGIPRD